ncbi:MAG: hypothetical protein M3375_08195 [Actinomycetota bacterium]|nr:hypothetical protein [Actinomycetota bacterium]
MSAHPEEGKRAAETADPAKAADDKPTDRTPPDYASREDMPELLVKLQERKARHKDRSKVYRVGNVVAGVLLVIAGIFLSGPGIPGPGFIVILLGLGLLALEFKRAEHLLERVIVWADKARDRTQRATVKEKAAAGALAALLAGAFVAAAILWDIPLLPV